MKSEVKKKNTNDKMFLQLVFVVGIKKSIKKKRQKKCEKHIKNSIFMQQYLRY